MKRKLFLIMIVLIAFSVAGCKRENKTEIPDSNVPVWHKYSYDKYNSFFYLQNSDNQLDIVVCGSIQKIIGRLELHHQCTAEQFEVTRGKMILLGATYEGTVGEPATEGYPDMTSYLSMIPPEKIQQLWNMLGF